MTHTSMKVSGCSTEVDRLPHEKEVMSLNPSRECVSLEIAKILIFFEQ